MATSPEWDSAPLQFELRTDDRAAPKISTVPSPFAILGRSPSCDLPLPHGDVSHRHALVCSTHGKLLCVDLQSRTGTRHAGEPQRAFWLPPASDLDIGPFHVQVDFPAQASSSNGTYPEDPFRSVELANCELPEIEIAVGNGRGESTPYRIDRVVTLIGRGSRCKLRARSQSVSNTHSCLLWTPEGLVVVDLLGKGGTFVNGEPIRYQLLQEGDELRAGKLHVRVDSTTIRNRVPSTVPAPESDTVAGVPAARDDESELSVSEYLDRLVTSRAATQGELGPFLADGAATTRTLAEWETQLLGAGLITPWHSKRVRDGRTTNFVVGERYRVLEPIRQGGMARVYRARDLRLNRDVAIKRPREAGEKSDIYRARFRREAMLNGIVDHPNVVRVLDVSPSFDFMVLEFVAGENLFELIRDRGALEPTRAAACIMQIARALQAVHALGIIHRDVKPANVLITPEGTARLFDFGLARLASDEAGLAEALEPITQVGMRVGTAQYMAPEQAVDCSNADARSDVYGLGCSLFEVLTGRRPYEADSEVETLRMHVKDRVPHLPGIDEDLQAICRKAMAKSPEERYSSAGAMSAALSEWLNRPSQELEEQAQHLQHRQDELDRQQAVIAERESSLSRLQNALETGLRDFEVLLRQGEENYLKWKKAAAEIRGDLDTQRESE